MLARIEKRRLQQKSCYGRTCEIGDYKFRRQHPMSGFVADFYCHEAKLIVEVDGSVHETEEQKDYDTGRTYELEELGVKLIRFTNEEVQE